MSMWILFSLWIPLASAVPSKRKPPKEAGEALYDDNCAQCHGARGLGDGPVSAVIASPALAGQIKREDYDAAVEIILKGQGQMPAYSLILNTNDARRILMWLSALDPETGYSPRELSEQRQEAKASADVEDAAEDADEEADEVAPAGDAPAEEAP